MQAAITLASGERIALMLAVIFAVVLVIHLAAGSSRLENRSGRLSILCLLALCVGSAGLLFVANGTADPHSLEGVEPFSPAELGSAGEIIGEALNREFLDGDGAEHAELGGLSLVFIDGKFDRCDFTARFTGDDGTVWLRKYNAFSDGRVSFRSAAEGEMYTVPAGSLISAFSELEALGWAGPDALEAPYLQLSMNGTGSSETGFVLAGGELVPGLDYAGGGVNLPLLEITMDTATGEAAIVNILLAE